MAYDLKIVGGTIIDGTGQPGYSGDVGIKDGKIVALGNAPDTAARTIKADGLVVSPVSSTSTHITMLRCSGIRC